MRSLLRFARPALARVAGRLAATQQEERGRRERIKASRERERAERAQARIGKRAAAAARDRAKQQAQIARDEARAAGERTAARAYQHYLDVRERVRRMNGAGVAVPLTAAESRLIDELGPLRDATPETIATLRRHCAPFTGVRASDYDTVSPELKARLAHERGVLRRQVPGDLLVDEPATLGGFGISKDHVRYNEDTLRCSKALVALDDAAVLGAFRQAGSRRVVWEIGGGWGGFAYQFKTRCPDVTYLITGIPDTFLVSAVYLMTMFPDARVRFCCPGTPNEALWQDWETVDFVFAPEASLASLQPPRLDMVLDVMTLRQMTPERVHQHVRHAYALGARYFYSLLPNDRDETATVWKPIERLYWPHPVPPRVDRMPPVLDLTGAPPLESDVAHLVGWRRLYS